jgi:hypothetical protein
MLEKTEGTIKNGQSRDTGNVGHTRHRPVSLDCPFLIVPSVFSNIYLSCVLCAQRCQCLWIVHSWLSLRFSLTFICPVSCVPNVARTLATLGTQGTGQINVRENRRDNQEWTRHWQRWAHKTQDDDKQNTKTQHRKLKRWATLFHYSITTKTFSGLDYIYE